MKNISNNTIITGVVGLIVGLIIGWMVGHSWAPSTASSKTTNTNNSTSTDMMATSSTTSMNSAIDTSMSKSAETNSAILVVDQKAGSTATVASVETDTSAWVVVREDHNGVLGNILGASRIDSGSSNNIVINLLRPTIAGKSYQVVLYKEDGDRKFDMKLDIPLTSNGVLVAQSFKTTAE